MIEKKYQPEKNKGFLITIEGIDGSGKSLFSRSLFEKLESLGYPTILTREPGGTPISNKIRDLIFNKEQYNFSKKTEFLLFAASRAQHCDELIIPALAAHNIVISDRMADSSLVYQGYVQGLPLEMIALINAWAMSDITPTITFYLKISAKTAWERIYKRNAPLTCFENSLSILEKAIEGFDTLVATKHNVITLDAHQPAHEIVDQALSCIMPFFEKTV